MNFYRESQEAEILDYWWTSRANLPEDDYRWIRNADFEHSEIEEFESLGYVFH